MTFRFAEKIGCQTDDAAAAMRVVSRKPVEAILSAGVDTVCIRQAAMACGR